MNKFEIINKLKNLKPFRTMKALSENKFYWLFGH